MDYSCDKDKQVLRCINLLKSVSNIGGNDNLYGEM